MIKKIARDVSEKLNATPSRDFDGMVGLEAHLRKMQALLDLDYDGVKMVGITGPAGIGKTTIARALNSLLSDRFQLTCFMDNLKGSYYSGLDGYGLKLRLQEKFLSNILNQNGMTLCHLGVMKERLCDKRVFIILDDVDNVKQLEALADETTWFGNGSRIVVTTENKELLWEHGINNIYHMGFPSDEEALEILCRYCFRKKHLYHDFEKLVPRVTKLCGNLPLGLSVVGSSLRGKKEDVIIRLETIIDRDIEDVLRVGYGSLDENEQTLFLHIAVFFNYKDSDLVKTMFADSDVDVKQGLKILVNRSLIEITTHGEIIVMHRLLQQVGKKAIHKQEPWKRRILIDAPEICDVVEHAKGTRNVVGISFDISSIREVSISQKAFKRLLDLRFLRVYKRKYDGNARMHIPGEMEFPCCVRLLDWEAYPTKSLPPSFHPEYLVELHMPNSQLEKLWEGTQPLPNLKKMDLSGSFHLKELPNLSNGTSVELLDLRCCESLVEIPSSCSDLHKLQKLWVTGCVNLQAIPVHMNLASLEEVFMGGCSRLRNKPVMSTNIRQLYISETAVEDVPASIKRFSRLMSLDLSCSGKLKGVTHLPTSLTQLDLRYSEIERIPECFKALHQLQNLFLSGCRRLALLPELPASLMLLMTDDCESLEIISCPLKTPNTRLKITNCFKLDRQSRRAVIKQSFILGAALLPGRQVPAEFDHRGRGNVLTIRPDGSPYMGFVVCLAISSNRRDYSFSQLLCRHIIAQDNLDPVENLVYVGIGDVFRCRTEHLFIFGSGLLDFYPSEVSREIVFEFSSSSHDFNIIECGARILSIQGSDESSLNQVFEDHLEIEPTVASDSTNEVENLEGDKQIGCWSWLFPCFDFDLSHFVRHVGSLVSGRRR
ncbi:hypothetical protein DY000_02045940 [Brassica cretica]|uniref:AAA+ ATPase domain-containing protein n=1 Tax=Brassica cretica TaxID=69181 RepID=A0ABQ7ETB8_BRACR|nr:hypothetical protein DY000_02045940 [Brassica cretica]